MIFFFNTVSGVAMDTQYYIKKNASALAVWLDSERILRNFKFDENTMALKKAVESSIEKCIAFDLVEELLKCDESVLNEVHAIIYNDRAAAWFHEVYADSDKELGKYMYLDTKEKPQIFNINQKVVDLLLQIPEDTLSTFMAEFCDRDGASDWNHRKIFRLHRQGKQRDAIALLLVQIYYMSQYNALKECIKIYCPLALQYL